MPIERDRLGAAAATQRPRQRYSWDHVTDAYDRLFRTMARARDATG